MKGAASISDNEKWQAVVNCDKSYDSSFFYGVRTTGIFCRPSCRAKTPAQANVVYFDNAEDAAAAGFRPCKRCCPDRVDFEPDAELANKAKDMLYKSCDSPVELRRISTQLGVSMNHLERLFRKHIGLTPTQYITGVRVDKALELLGKPDGKILEIAYTSGFKSLSYFYKCFKEQTGYTPEEYRRKGGL